MTLPPQGHPQYELRRRIADCRERLRRTRTGQKGTERATHTQARAGVEEGTVEESDEAHGQQSEIKSRQ
jgi:hypothetical protein